MKKRFANTYEFSGHDVFIVILQKSVYPYEYMDDRQKLNETSIPEKEHL